MLRNLNIIIFIQMMKDFESLTVISVEFYCKVNPALVLMKTLEK